MFVTTYNIIKEQLSSTFSEKCNYAKIILAPLLVYCIIFLISFSDKFVLPITVLLSYLAFFYACKSIVQLTRLIVNNEAPNSTFSIHLFKQAYLFLSYLILFVLFLSTVSTLLMMLDMKNSIVSVILLVIVFSLFIYIVSWYPFNLISVATDVPVDFFKIQRQIGYFAFTNLFLIVITSILTYLIYLVPMHYLITVFFNYVLFFILFGCIARNFVLWHKTQK